MEIVAIDHVQLAMPKGKESEAIAFYQDILGIPETPKPATLSGRGGAWFERGDLKIHLGVENEFRPARKAHPGLLVSDLDQLIDTLTASGCEVTIDTSLPDMRRAFSSDPFGNRIEFVQSAKA
jgi:catechol 2,3-dioxygenase-like lactoylglutathione lyase family enzyme